MPCKANGLKMALMTLNSHPVGGLTNLELCLMHVCKRTFLDQFFLFFYFYFLFLNFRNKDFIILKYQYKDIPLIWDSLLHT